MLCLLLLPGMAQAELGTLSKKAESFVKATEANKKACLANIRNSSDGNDCFLEASKSYLRFARVKADAEGEAATELWVLYGDLIQDCEDFGKSNDIYREFEQAAICQYMTARYVILPVFDAY